MKRSGKERKGTEMIKDVPLTGIFINDQEAALDFYTNKLGPREDPGRTLRPKPRTLDHALSPGMQDKDHDSPEKGREGVCEKALLGRCDAAPILVLCGH
jgi:catechol 2,3-dioxygenase-like lactoylglutathione lyase family enzyme